MNRTRAPAVFSRAFRRNWVVALVVLVCLAIQVRSLAQSGTINFNTFTVGARVYDSDGTTPLSGASYSSQLYVGIDRSTLVAVGSPAPFRTGATAGYIISGDVVVPGFPAGSSMVVEARAWRTADGGSYEQAVGNGGPTGKSNLILVNLGSPGGPPPPPKAGADLIGLTGYVIGGGFLLSLGDPRTQTFSLGGTQQDQSCGIAVGAKVIREFKPEADGFVNAYTQNATVDAVLEAYYPYYLAGDSSTRLKCGDLPDGPDARISFFVQAYNTYYLTVAATGGQTGEVDVHYLLEEPRPRLGVHVNPGGRPEMEIEALPGVAYIVETANVLPATSWTTLGTSTLNGRGLGSVLLPDPQTAAAGYFRVRSVSGR
jgi:hypothetical protein